MTDQRSPRVKPKHIVVLILVVIACLGLAWWQWTKFESGQGSFQNLGYALQWPVYAIVAVVFYRKTLRYEEELAQDDPVASVDGAKGGMRAPAAERSVEIDMPARPEIDVETFNEMNQPTRRRVREQREEQAF